MAHIIEAAKSGRAKCRKCKKAIAKGDLRFGWETGNDFDPDGGTTHKWFHMTCAAEARPAELGPTLASYTGDVDDREALEKAIAENQPKTHPFADKAPSGRAKCLQCGEKIAKDDWRVVVEREIDTGSFVRTGAGYLHAGCAAEFTELGDQIKDTLKANSGLSDEDAEALLAEL